MFGWRSSSKPFGNQNRDRHSIVSWPMVVSTAFLVPGLLRHALPEDCEVVLIR
jgi:ribosomal protein L32E